MQLEPLPQRSPQQLPLEARGFCGSAFRSRERVFRVFCRNVDAAKNVDAQRAKRQETGYRRERVDTSSSS